MAAKAHESHVELDLGRYELRRHGARVRLEKKPMELLIFLAGRRDQLVSREEIVAKLWQSDLFIDTHLSLNNVIRKIRAALGDDAARPRFIETVVGKGYRFVGPLRVIQARYASTAAAESGERKTAHENSQGWNDRASLALLPLQTVGTIPDDHGLGLGFADAMIARLGNLQGVDVLPIGAVLNASGDISPAETAARLGVRFLVRGAMQNSKGVWRLSLQMFDSRKLAVCFAKKCDLHLHRLSETADEIAKGIAAALNRPAGPSIAHVRQRFSKEPMAYAEFMRGYRLSSSGDSAAMEEAAQHLSNAVTRDPAFALAHAVLSFVYATRHFEFDPSSEWLEKAEFHCQRALETDPDLAEGHVAQAFLLWGPSKNFQHLEAIAELKRALALQNNQPHAYNRLGSILAHIGLLEQAREMFERGSAFHPRKAVSHSIVQVYAWGGEYDRAEEEIQVWQKESPGNIYPRYFGPQLAMMTGDLKRAKLLLEEAADLLPEEPLIVSMQGVYHALHGKEGKALDCLTAACASPKSFGHTHHTYYQLACILSLLGQSEAAFRWLERSVSTGFACWPFFLKDPWLKNVHQLPAFEVLVSSLQAKYPSHLGVL